jgi:hypothetical protein
VDRKGGVGTRTEPVQFAQSPMFDMQAMPWPFEPGRSPESSEAIVEPAPHLFQDSFRDRKEPSRPSMIVSNSQDDTLIYVHAGSND